MYIFYLTFKSCPVNALHNLNNNDEGKLGFILHHCLSQNQLNMYNAQNHLNIYDTQNHLNLYDVQNHFNFSYVLHNLNFSDAQNNLRLNDIRNHLKMSNEMIPSMIRGILNIKWWFLRPFYC